MVPIQLNIGNIGGNTSSQAGGYHRGEVDWGDPSEVFLHSHARIFAGWAAGATAGWKETSPCLAPENQLWWDVVPLLPDRSHGHRRHEFTTSRGDTFGFAGGGVLSGEFTTSLGDTYPYTISAITTDSYGNTYVLGSRQLGGPAPGSSDAFVSKFDSQGDRFFTGTFAGKGVDTGTAIALDPAGNIYIAGTTTSNDFPLSNALQTKPNASGTGFIIKLTFDGSTAISI